MRSTGIFEAKRNFSELVAAVEAGEEVRITRHGREVVRMLPLPAGSADRQHEADKALQRLKRLRAGIKPGPGWCELRDDGRKT